MKWIAPVAALLVAGAATAAEQHRPASDPAALVNPFIGTTNGGNVYPGATLPFVETHIMEHGLIMLSGQGVYRLEDSWYPVRAGDAIWMAPYCAQWFVAMGKVPARYLYYKDVNRAAL